MHSSCIFPEAKAAQSCWSLIYQQAFEAISDAVHVRLAMRLVPIYWLFWYS